MRRCCAILLSFSKGYVEYTIPAFEYKNSMLTLPELELNSHDLTTLRIGIKDSARYIGGINLFEKNSGDTEQDIIVQVSYKTQ